MSELTVTQLVTSTILDFCTNNHTDVNEINPIELHNYILHELYIPVEVILSDDSLLYKLLLH